MYINGLNNAVEFSDVHHFADDTNVLYSRKYVKDTNRKNNFDLKNILMWIRANKILLNADKTKLVLFRSKKKTEKALKININFRISGQKIKIQSKKILRSFFR